MLLSYRYQYLFVHIPKTGGSSISMALLPTAHRPARVPINRLLALVGIRVNHFLGPYRWRRFRQHERAEVIRRYLPAEVYERFFKFAFVRNPWDLLVSYYHWIVQSPSHGRQRRIRRMAFPDYVDYEIGRGKLLQKDFVCDRHGNLIVDFVGRFENLHADFQQVCDRIGYTTNLPHYKKTAHDDYRSYYTDALARRVGEYFRPDIEYFGYTFDGVVPGSGAICAAQQRAA